MPAFLVGVDPVLILREEALVTGYFSQIEYLKSAFPSHVCMIDRDVYICLQCVFKSLVCLQYELLSHLNLLVPSLVIPLHFLLEAQAVMALESDL